MNILGIDCTSGLGTIVITDQKVYCHYNYKEKKQSASLLTAIEAELKNANLKLEDLDCLAVCVGPGSFTGIRVAISTIKGLAVGLGLKVITFDSFDQIMGGIKDKNFGIICEGFGNNFYYYFKKFGRVFKGCATEDKIAPLAEGVNVYSVSDVVASSITKFTVQVERKICPDLVICQKAKNGDFVQTNQIAPQYLRASQAEIERDKKQGGQL